jgi:hypothetical protein
MMSMYARNEADFPRELKPEELDNVSGGVTALDVNRSSWDTFGDTQTRLVVSGKGD